MNGSIYIASGVTSNLFASLISLFPALFTKNTYATARQTSDVVKLNALSALGVKFVDNVQQVPNVQRILWLSTSDDAEALANFVSVAPTLAISSGAIMDFIRGRQTEDALNAYQKSKLTVMRVKGLTKFVPGFYLENAGRLPEWASKGLHGDTTKKLFADTLAEDLDMSKCYSVTPKSYICDAIVGWMNEPSLFDDGPTIVSSDREYCRWELRTLAGLESPSDTPQKLELVYAQFKHALAALTEADVQRACQRTRMNEFFL